MKMLILLMIFAIGAVGIGLMLWYGYREALNVKRTTKTIKFVGGPLDGQERKVIKPGELITEGNRIYKDTSGNGVYSYQGEWV